MFEGILLLATIIIGLLIWELDKDRQAQLKTQRERKEKCLKQ